MCMFELFKQSSDSKSFNFLLCCSVSDFLPHSESMILLGSIERLPLQSLLSLQLSHQRRLEYLRQLAQENGTHDHLSSLTSDSTPSSPCTHTHLNASANAGARQAVRFLVSTQQVWGVRGRRGRAGDEDTLGLGWDVAVDEKWIRNSMCGKHVVAGKGTDRVFWITVW